VRGPAPLLSRAEGQRSGFPDRGGKAAPGTAPAGKLGCSSQSLDGEGGKSPSFLFSLDPGASLDLRMISVPGSLVERLPCTYVPNTGKNAPKQPEVPRVCLVCDPSSDCDCLGAGICLTAQRLA
jgi:hypothetical protein